MHDYGAPHHHPHEHDHDHAHSHDHSQSDATEVNALLSYMHHHNEHHTQELLELADRLAALGSDAAASLVREAAASYTTGNEALGKALAALQ